MAKVATPAQQAQWPAPNYNDPQTRVGVLLGLTISTSILMVLFVAGRFYGRGRLTSVLGLADWIMLCSAFCAIGVNIIACASVNYGLGYHIWDLRPSWKWSAQYSKMAFAADILFPLSCSTAKISVVLTYLRLFPSKGNKIFCHAMIAFLILYTLTCVFLMLFQCKPISGYWDQNVKIQCINIRVVLVVIAALNSVSDFIVFLWPLKPLWSVQLPLKQRLGLVCVFGVGCIVCVAGVCRIYYLEVYFNSYDALWNAALVYLVMGVEMNAGIICGCLPGVKPVLSKFFPSLFGSSVASRSRPTYGNPTSGYDGRSGTHPFQSLTDKSNLTDQRSRTRALEHALSFEDIELDRNGNSEIESSSRAWASVGQGDSALSLPTNAIAVNQVVHVEREERFDNSTEVSKGDGGSEEWIIGPGSGKSRIH